MLEFYTNNHYFSSDRPHLKRPTVSSLSVETKDRKICNVYYFYYCELMEELSEEVCAFMGVRFLNKRNIRLPVGTSIFSTMEISLTSKGVHW